MPLPSRVLRADDPRRYAEALAQLLGGDALRCPPLRDCWVVLAKSQNGVSFEVHGRDRLNEPVAMLRADRPLRLTVTSRLMPQALMRIARDMDWPARRRRRGTYSGVEVTIGSEIQLVIRCASLSAPPRGPLEQGDDYVAHVAPNWWAQPLFGPARRG